MKKIAFFLNNPTLPHRDYTSLLDGNPGVGGSEYEFMLVSYLLEIRNNNLEIYLITTCQGIYPHKNLYRVKDLNEACEYALEHNIAEMVVDIKHFSSCVLGNYKDRLKIIIWAHNNVSYKLLNLFYKLSYIKKIVNCGREEMELYRDHMASLKSTYIYNIFPIKHKSYYLSRLQNRDNHNVVYMGSIVKAKGFHVLAKAWKHVVSEIPDAQLYVIGSGKLYNGNACLGKYGIADRRYEELFAPYITDKYGSIIKSVHFLGLLGDDKYDELGKCKVGVPNPTGSSETFCICALEMQLMGCNITTNYHPAYLDTVMNQTYLYKHTRELANYIVARLKREPDSIDKMYDFVSNKFGIDGNIEKWESLLSSDISIEEVSPISKYNYQHKTIKDRLLNLKIAHPFFRHLPCVEEFYLVKERIYGKIDSLHDILFRILNKSRNQ